MAWFSRALKQRMSQLMNLLNLPIPVQEGLLLGKIDLSERHIRRPASRAEWDKQMTEAQTLSSKSESI